jgi:S1-C subfamily serine protease
VEDQSLLIKLFTSLALLLTLAAQGNVVRVRVALPDGTGTPIPLPRVLLLVSDNPATAEPRRVRTDANGIIELALAPGSYTIESDRPVAFGGKAYTWTQIVQVIAGKETVVDLTAMNAEIAAASSAPDAADAVADASSAALLSKWHDSVVEIWTPTQHAQGFVIDAKGLIATSHGAIDGATSVEVEFRTRSEHFKVPGTVIVDDRATGAAVVWIDPESIGSIAPIDLRCGAAAPEVGYEDEVSTIAAPMLAGKDFVDGVVTRVTSQAIYADLRISRETSGGPVFNANGELLGISSIDADPSRFTRVAAWTVPIERACEALALAAKPLASGPPPKGVRLPIETTVASATTPLAKTPKQFAAPPVVKASDFDLALMTSSQAREPGSSDPRWDLANWTDYVRYAPNMLLVRVSPQFEEGVWKMLGRVAASTQGVNLPPLKSFSANFLRMRAYCGDAEVVPIHPFVIERRVNDKQTIREGLYVFDINAFGTNCSSIRFAMYSEKSPDRPDTKEIDPKLLAEVTTRP